jgi:hypothetical protein
LLRAVHRKIFVSCGFGRLSKNLFILLDTTSELLYFSSALACFYLPGQRFIVSLQDFKPVTYWQTASNCLQSRQGSQTIQLVPLDFEGSTRNFGENAWPILATPEVRPTGTFQNGGLGRYFPIMELLVHCYQGFINNFY